MVIFRATATSLVNPPSFPLSRFSLWREQNIQYVPSLFEIHFKVEHTCKILKILLFFFILAADTNMIIDHQLFLQLEKRVADAEPCHNYRDNGDGPEGCWWCRNFEIYVLINNLELLRWIIRLDKSIDSTSAKILYNQLPSWHNECFNQVNLFNRLFIIHHPFILKTAFMTGIEYAFLFFTNSGL